MEFVGISGINLRGLDRKNILLGKNGCGKSRLLKLVEQHLRNRPDIGALKYLSPERGGALQYQPDIEHNLTANINWLADTRRKNQADQFRQQSAAQFRRLELLILREIERNPTLRADLSVTFDKTVNRINALLDRVYLVRGDPAFVILDRRSNTQVTAQDVSSGEAELISLGIECLVFERDRQADKLNVLLIDEPDVHLHPDLQARFAVFIEELAALGESLIIIATHSTALLGAVADDDHTRLAFMKYGDTDLQFVKPSDVHKKVLPVFGAHPLSNVFNQAPVLLLEGEDDERLWQQAVRSAKGRLRLYPCSVDGITHLIDFEREVARILEAVYDSGVGYSLRDRDEQPTEIADVGPVRRMRLNCRAAENLIVSDEVLAQLGINWPQVESGIELWLASNAGHPHFGSMSSFKATSYNRSNADLKEIRNDLMGITGSNKPWEVVVGQAVATLVAGQNPTPPNTLQAMLGHAVCQQLLQLK